MVPDVGYDVGGTRRKLALWIASGISVLCFVIVGVLIWPTNVALEVEKLPPSLSKLPWQLGHSWTYKEVKEGGHARDRYSRFVKVEVNHVDGSKIIVSETGGFGRKRRLLNLNGECLAERGSNDEEWHNIYCLSHDTRLTEQLIFGIHWLIGSYSDGMYSSSYSDGIGLISSKIGSEDVGYVTRQLEGFQIGSKFKGKTVSTPLCVDPSLRHKTLKVGDEDSLSLGFQGVDIGAQAAERATIVELRRWGKRIFRRIDRMEAKQVHLYSWKPYAVNIIWGVAQIRSNNSTRLRFVRIKRGAAEDQVFNFSTFSAELTDSQMRAMPYENRCILRWIQNDKAGNERVVDFDMRETGEINAIEWPSEKS